MSQEDIRLIARLARAYGDEVMSLQCALASDGDRKAIAVVMEFAAQIRAELEATCDTE